LSLNKEKENMNKSSKTLKHRLELVREEVRRLTPHELVRIRGGGDGPDTHAGPGSCAGSKPG
jgi:hypothetical protein